MNLRRLYQILPTKAYNPEAANDPDSYGSCIHITLHARFGKVKHHLVISPYVEYDKIHKELTVKSFYNYALLFLVIASPVQTHLSEPRVDLRHF